MGIGINGMGRIGRLALRAALGGVPRPQDDPRRANRLDIIHVNEIRGGPAATAHLLEFDSIHGRWHGPFLAEDEKSLAVEGRLIGFSEAADPGDIPWATSVATWCWNAREGS